MLVAECARLGIHDATTFVSYVSQELLPKVYAGADLLAMAAAAELLTGIKFIYWVVPLVAVMAGRNRKPD